MHFAYFRVFIMFDIINIIIMSIGKFHSRSFSGRRPLKIDPTGMVGWLVELGWMWLVSWWWSTLIDTSNIIIIRGEFIVRI